MIVAWLRKDHHLALLFILLAAVAVRFWDIGNLHYHHDELSALLRTRFSSFSELIASGVQIDGHPAGVQVFLWLWTAIGGYGNFWVKLPFLLAGVSSVYLIYRIGALLFGKTEGVWAAAMMATFQYGILYSQWARPYAFGCLFVLLFALTLLQLRKKPSRLRVLFLAISVAGAAYTHYFALLQVIIVAVVAFFLLSRKSKLYLLLGSILGFLLWLPHLNTTIHQLSLGGIGDWLQKPASGFWIELLDFSFHYSWWLKGLLALLFLGSVFTAFEAWKRGWGARGMLAAVVVIPYAIAYYYSLEVSALLHHGTAFFAFPFLLLLLASWFRWQPRLNAVLLLALVITAIATLSRERQHFITNYETEYQTSLVWLSELNARESGSIATFIDLRQDAVNLLFDQKVVPELPVQFIWPLWDSGKMHDYLNGLNQEKLFVAIDAGSRPEYLAAALDAFPCIEAVKYFSSGEAYLLSKRCNSLMSIPGIGAVENDFLTKENPYSHALEGEWRELAQTDRNILLKAIWIGEPLAQAALVFEMDNALNPLWRAVDAKEFNSQLRKKHSLYHVLYTREISAEPDDRWKSFFWLSNSYSVRLMRLEAFTFPANPVKFGLFGAIDPAKP